MSDWGTVRRAAPGFARDVERRFDKYTHKVVATVRADGSPRISGNDPRGDDGDRR